MKAATKSFLGVGWSFPPEFVKFHQSVKLVSDIDDIRESIIIILGTIPGERVMQPEFGCTLHQLVFEKNDANLYIRINEAIEFALLHFEPRIKFLGTAVEEQESDEGFLKISIHFSIITTNTRHNIVYPFYINEGTNIRR